jgi:hypothetical protein
MVPMQKYQTKQELAKEILAYFLRNPLSADNLEGVAQWRLLDQVIHHALQETNDALEWLVSQGYLVMESTAGSDRIFRLNREKRNSALRFMKETEPPGESDG